MNPDHVEATPEHPVHQTGDDGSTVPVVAIAFDEVPPLPDPALLKTPDGEYAEDFAGEDAPFMWAWVAHGHDTGMEPFYSEDQVFLFGADCREQALAQKERDARDAARYRYLRSGALSWGQCRAILNDTPHGIDDAVDAAMAQDGKGVAGKLPSDEKAVHPVSASAATVPEGMVLVPVQSTPAIDAVIREVAPRWFAPSVWTSLLGAAAADQLNGGK